MVITDFLTEARIRKIAAVQAAGRRWAVSPDHTGEHAAVAFALQARGQESMLGLGAYPATSLKGARAKRTELRAALEAGKNPSAERRAERVSSEQYVIRCVPAVTQVPSRNSQVPLAATSSDAPPPRMADVNF